MARETASECSAGRSRDVATGSFYLPRRVTASVRGDRLRPLQNRWREGSPERLGRSVALPFRCERELPVKLILPLSGGTWRRAGPTRTDYVDVFLLHSLPEDELANDELFESLEAMRSAGMLHHYGFSMIRLPAKLSSRLPAGVEVIGSAINPAETENIAELPALAKRVGVLGYQPFDVDVVLVERGGTAFVVSCTRRKDRRAAEIGPVPDSCPIRLPAAWHFRRGGRNIESRAPKRDHPNYRARALDRVSRGDLT